MKKRDALVVGILLLMAASLFFLSDSGFNVPASPSATVPAGMIEKVTTDLEASPATEAATKAVPTETPRIGEHAITTKTQTHPAWEGEGMQAAYLLVSVRGLQYEPILLDQEADYTLRQKDTSAENVIHVTRDSIRMASSTCENQDCVEQGIVSVSNRKQRLLRNMIICLPNEVTLELITSEEADQIHRENEASK